MSKLIVANWKMNGNTTMVEDFTHKLNSIASSEVVLCLPHTYLYAAKDKNFSLGGQNCSHQKQGPYTGEVSAGMLYDIGCKYVILGHSERRKHYNETNNIVKQKAKISKQNQLTPIICIGEKDRNTNIEELFKQCEESICDDVIIAYEPVWAIGTGITPTIEEIEKITMQLHNKYNLPILYGGSVTQHNSSDIMKVPTLSGLLVGGSSLDFNVFSQILSTLV